MDALFREWRLLPAASRLALLALGLLAAIAVGLGLAATGASRADIARVAALEARETRAITGYADGNAGTFGYYRHFPVWRAPGDLAFLAPSRGDAVPEVQRIRILALEAQINDNETSNPELLLAGRFDFAFVLLYLAPLVLIALLHDLWSAEREAGRLDALQSLPNANRRVWAPRAILRFAGVALALLLPLGMGAAIEGTGLPRLLAAAGLVLLSLGFWALLSLAVARTTAASATQAAVLAGLWFAIALVVPAAAHLAINRAVPLPDAAAITRENREEVHAGWDRPKAETMQRFVAHYPEFAGRAEVGMGFRWHWYYAFQHLGDLHVAADSAARDAGIARREALAQGLGWLLPPLKLTQAVQSLAGSDVGAELAYRGRIRAHHRELRVYHYPFLFDERPMSAADVAAAPSFGTPPAS